MSKRNLRRSIQALMKISSSVGETLGRPFGNDNKGRRDTIHGQQTVPPWSRKKAKHSTPGISFYSHRSVLGNSAISTFQGRFLNLGEKMGLVKSCSAGWPQPGWCRALGSINTVVPKKSLVTGNLTFPSLPTATVTTLLPTGFLRGSAGEGVGPQRSSSVSGAQT